jgi:hypothetical protein
VQEGVQGAGEQVSQNAAQKEYVDPKQALGDQVAENVLASFAVGGLTGGLFSGVGGHSGHEDHEDKAMETGASLVTPEDESSPLPTDLIQEGKGAIANDLDLGAHNDILRNAGMPGVGANVQVDRGPLGSSTGTVQGAFSVGDDQGTQHGIRIGMDDGSTYEELFKDIQSGGHSINELVDKYLPGAVDKAGAISAPVAEGPAQPNPNSEEISQPSDFAALKAKMRGAESSGNDQAHSKTSSASGRYQFTDATWAALGGDPAKRNDPAEQERLMDKLLAQNASALDRAGLKTTDGNLYLAHFLGSAGAINALEHPNDAVSAKVQAANPFAQGWSNGQLAAWANRKMGGKPGEWTGNPNTSADRAWAEKDKGADGEELQPQDQIAFPGEEQAAKKVETSDEATTPDTKSRDGAPYKPNIPSGMTHEDVLGLLNENDEAKPLLNLGDKSETGWKQINLTNGDGAVIVNGTEAREFSGAGWAARAHAYAIDNPVGSSEQRTAAEPTPQLSKQEQLKLDLANNRAPTEPTYHLNDALEQHGVTQPILTAMRVQGYPAPRIGDLGTLEGPNGGAQFIKGWEWADKGLPRPFANKDEAAGFDAYHAARDGGQAQPKEQEGDWRHFAPETGTLGVPRAEMPQVKGEHRGALVNFLQSRGVTATEETVPASSLKPTQAEYSPQKVASWNNGNMKPEDRKILVSSDGHILDGHHQWVKQQELGQDTNIIRLSKPIRELLPLVHEFPSATVSEGANTPQDKLKAKMLAAREAKEPLAAKTHAEAETALKAGRRIKTAGATYGVRETPKGWVATTEYDDTKGIVTSHGGGLEAWSKEKAIKQAMENIAPRLPKAESAGPRVFVNHVGPDGKTDAERGRPLTELERESHKLRNEAEPHQKALVEWAQKLADKEGAKFVNPGIKSFERMVEKVSTEDYASVRELKDVVRGGFVVDSPEQGERIAAAIKEKFGKHEDKGEKVVQGGYFDQKIIPHLSEGTPAEALKGELQIIPRPIYEQKARENQATYDKWRAIPGALTDDPPPEARKLEEQMIASYAKAVSGTSFASRFKSGMDSYAARNSFAKSVWDKLEPGFVTNPEAGPQPLPSLNTKANPLPPETPLATGRPSISENENLPQPLI